MHSGIFEYDRISAGVWSQGAMTLIFYFITWEEKSWQNMGQYYSHGQVASKVRAGRNGGCPILVLASQEMLSAMCKIDVEVPKVVATPKERKK